MIDLGGATGSIFYALKDRFDVDSIRYLLIEPYKVFVDDFLDNFPSQTAIVGDAQAFIGMTDDVFPDAPYNVFFASLVFCMIKPDIVRKTLKRAAALADNIVIFDMVENLTGKSTARTQSFSTTVRGDNIGILPTLFPTICPGMGLRLSL